MSAQISVVIPVLDYEPGLRKTLSQLKKLRNKEIVLVLTPGGNSKKTKQIAQKFRCKLVIEKRRGYGRAYLTGFKAARGKIIATLDADGSYPVHLLLKYLRIFEKKQLDFVTVNRFANLKSKSMSPTHWVGNKGLTFLANVLFNLRLKDSQSGMWLFKRGILPLLRLSCEGMTLSTEIKIKAFKHLGIEAEEFEGSYASRLGVAKLRAVRDGLKIVNFLLHTRPNKTL